MNQKKSAEVIVVREIYMKDRTILNLGKQGGISIPPKCRKHRGTDQKDGYLSRDKLETEGYIGTRRNVDMDMKEQDGIKLIDQVIPDENLWLAYKKVKANKGAPGVDGITVNELESHMRKYYQGKRQIASYCFRYSLIRSRLV